ncbi:ATP-binding protein [Gaopeijia maritima]|uniref:DUF87 domain-containing protein n=1 Tax=Gaopeijia maritima TaxID=3119007 RepID=A0ABU9E4P1_9BACT
MTPSDLHLGALLDPESGERTDRPLALAPESFTTHGVIVGMTGSGKTGLGIVLLEEVLASGRPALILDPKGDLANLALLFPELGADDFEPWVDEAEARREGVTRRELAASTAATWSKGLGSWGIDGERIRALRDGVSLRVYTPGSTAGAPLDLVGDLQPPAGADAETIREAAESLASGLLTLAGIDSDPLTTPEHILLATLVERGWTSGETLSLETLIGGIQSPPFRKLGVFEVDTFVPPAARMKLALRLNGLVASPSFAAWRTGDPLDVQSLLWAPDGRPRASVVQLAHLSEPERIFVVTLLLSRAISWMRAQPGTSDLRAMIYIDELFGFAPPTANPPSKTPLLTLFKQARAHGLGLVVSTQNPVDMDYKLMSNAGTWMVGRLQTERDKARVIEALRSADGSVDVSAWDARLGALGKRQFVVKRTRSAQPELFTTRWAMSYLRGPVTRAELAALPPETIAAEGGGKAEPSTTGGRTGSTESAAATSTGAAEIGRSLADDESPLMPEIADGVRVTWLDPAAPWAGKLGLSGRSGRLEAGLAGRVRMVFDETRADLRHEVEWEVVFPPPLEALVRPEAMEAVDYDARDFRPEAPADARYVLPQAPLDAKSFINQVGRDLRDRLHATLELTLYHNPELKLYSRVGESKEQFQARCLDAAEERADAEASKLRARFEAKIDTAEDQVDRAEARLRELDVDVSSRRQQELVSGAGTLIGMFLGGRRSTRSLSSIASRRSQTRRTEERRRSAEDKLEAEREDVEQLEARLAEELAGIWEKWKAASDRIEIVEVGLEKNDIDVSDIEVFWAAREE